MRTLAACALLILLCAPPAFAKIAFPELTGRVVDDAHILSAPTVQSLERSLTAEERATGNQVVVATVKSLQGAAIETYAYQLGRAWGIGQKDKNNGVVLLVAPVEHKVYIAVGYGLEGVLTDAASSAIIQSVILPDFRAGHMEQGVIGGTAAILSVLGGKGIAIAGAAVPATAGDAAAQAHETQSMLLSFVLLSLLIKAVFIVAFFYFLRFTVRHPLLVATMLAQNSSRFGSSRIGGSSGGFSSGGGFSGGGGSFGGGGAGGSW